MTTDEAYSRAMRGYRHGVAFIPSPPKEPTMTDAEIVAAQKAGMAVTDIAKRSKRPLQDVREVLIAAGRYRRA